MTCSDAVDLLGCYSKRTSWTKREQPLPHPTDGDQQSALRRRRPAVVALSDADVEALVEAYRAGATVYELATRFKIHRTTVSQHLHRQGVTLRRVGLDDKQCQQAVRLYCDGNSLARIGARLGVGAGTVHQALRARGVEITRGVEIRRPWDRG
jgi:DNA-directed RNA polymerase specialized sigma24 family protein